MLTHWTPARPTKRTDAVRTFLDAFFSDRDEEGEDLSNRTWRPPANIRETDDAYMLAVELPGMKKDNIEITVENGFLQLRGERQLEDETKEGSYHRIERAYGTFVRRFTLPNAVEADKTDANFQDGILTLTLPKASTAKPRRISVN